MEDSKQHRITVLVAIIGLMGVLGAAVIANFDKIFSASNKPTATVSPSPDKAAAPVTPAKGVEAPVRRRHGEYLGALDGIYISNKNDELTVNWAKRSFDLTHFNCAIQGNLVETDEFWKIVIVNTDGVCSLIDEDDFGKEVGKITPEKGSLANSGHVGRALVNFDKASLTELSGVYVFTANDIEDLRRQREGK